MTANVKKKKKNDVAAAPTNDKRQMANSNRARALRPIGGPEGAFGKLARAVALLGRRHFEMSQNAHKEASFKTRPRWRRSVGCLARGARGNLKQLLPISGHFVATEAF